MIFGAPGRSPWNLISYPSGWLLKTELLKQSYVNQMVAFIPCFHFFTAYYISDFIVDLILNVLI